MKRIFIIQNTPLGAPLPLSIYLTGLLSNFKKSKEFEINLIVGKSKNIPLDIKNLCGKIYQFNGSTYSIKDNLKFSFFVNRILREENEKRKIDIVHCFYPNSSLLGGVMFKGFGKETKLIYDVRSPWIDMSIERGFINKGIVPFYRWVLYSEERFLGKFVDSFMFVTKGLSRYYRNKIGIRKPQKVYDSPSGVDLKKFIRVKTNVREKYGVREDEILIGSIGGIAKVRKQDEFLDIFKEIVSKNKKVKLMFVGEGDLLEELKEKAREMNLDKCVIFTGKIEHKEIPKYLSAFDYGLNHLPDMFIHRYNFSLKILEYLGCNVPVIASKIESNVEISRQLPHIYIYKTSEDILKFISKKRKIKVPENLVNYSWPSLIQKYLKMWEEVE